ncbi:MAG: pilus assembly protein PilP [Betaproteobacteria bacterium]
MNLGPVLSALFMGALGLTLPLASSDWRDESQALERKRTELQASLARAKAKLLEMQGALSADPMPPAVGPPTGADRFHLHRLALTQGLRVAALKPAGDAVASTSVNLDLRGSYEALVSFISVLARSDALWGLQQLQLAPGTDRGLRMSLRLLALPPGHWVLTRPAESVGRFVWLIGADPFAARPPWTSPLLRPASAAAPADPLSDVPVQWRLEFARERQPLEALPLRELAFTGTFRQGPTWVALLRSGGAVHTLNVGDYLGPDLGRIQSVDQDGLDLRELKRDVQGRWSEHVRRWQVGAAP